MPKTKNRRYLQCHAVEVGRTGNACRPLVLNPREGRKMPLETSFRSCVCKTTFSRRPGKTFRRFLSDVRR